MFFVFGSLKICCKNTKKNYFDHKIETFFYNSGKICYLCTIILI